MINSNASHAYYSYDPFKAAEGARTSGSQIQGFSGQPDADPRLRPATGNLTYQGSSGEPVKYATNQHYETKIVGSRILEPVEQLPPNVVMRKTNQLYLQPEQLNSIQYVRPVANQASFVQSTQPVQRYSAVSQQRIPMSAIVQPIVQHRVIQTPANITTQGPTIKQTVSKVATVETQPPQHLDPIVKYEYQKQPIVQTVRQSSWQSYYEPKKAPLVSAPPPAAPEKSSCSPILCAILGLLALGGLIAGIVLAAKANSGYGQPSAGISQTQGTISTDKASSGQLLSRFWVGQILYFIFFRFRAGSLILLISCYFRNISRLSRIFWARSICC